jgi:hypothetical protein
MKIAVPVALYVVVVAAIVFSPRPRFLDVITHQSSTAMVPPRYRTALLPRGAQVIGSLDTRALVGQLGTKVAVSGWAAATAPNLLRGIEILVDGRLAQITRTRESRPDVAETYAREDFLYSGWTFELDMKNLQLGHHVIDCRATRSDGSTTELGKGDLLVIE